MLVFDSMFAFLKLNSPHGSYSLILTVILDEEVNVTSERSLIAACSRIGTPDVFPSFFSPAFRIYVKRYLGNGELSAPYSSGHLFHFNNGACLRHSLSPFSNFDLFELISIFIRTVILSPVLHSFSSFK